MSLEHGQLWREGDYSIIAMYGSRMIRCELNCRGELAGNLTLRQGVIDNTWYEVLQAQVLPPHQRKGLGTELYRQALTLIMAPFKGMASRPETRKNQLEVPRIWRNLGATEKNGWFYLEKKVDPTQVSA